MRRCWIIGMCDLDMEIKHSSLMIRVEINRACALDEIRLSRRQVAVSIVLLRIDSPTRIHSSPQKITFDEAIRRRKWIPSTMLQTSVRLSCRPPRDRERQPDLLDILAMAEVILGKNQGPPAGTGDHQACPRQRASEEPSSIEPWTKFPR